MGKWKIVNKDLNDFIEKQRLNKWLLNNVTNIQSHRRKSFNFKHPEALSPSGIWRITFINQSYFAIFK